MTITASLTHQVWTLIKEKCIMLDPTAQETQGFCSSTPPGPTSSMAEDICLLGICTQSTYIHYIYTRLDTQICHPSGWHLISFTPVSPVSGTQAHGPSGR